MTVGLNGKGGIGTSDASLIVASNSVLHVGSPTGLANLAIATNYSTNGAAFGLLDALQGTVNLGLYVTGTATLGGTLVVSLINGFNPQGSFVFDILIAGGINGEFEVVELPALASLGEMTVTYGPGAVQVSVVGYGGRIDFVGGGHFIAAGPANREAIGDLDGDGDNVLAEWGPCENCDLCPWDIDEDRDVDVNDFLELLSPWGSCQLPPLPPGP